MLTTIAAALKYSGMILGVYLGIHGVKNNYRNEKSGKLTSQGRNAIILLGLAGIAAVGGSLLDDVSGNQNAVQRLQEENNRHQELLKSQGQLLVVGVAQNPSYVRFTEYFRLWENLLEQTLDPSPVASPDSGITNALHLKTFPTEFLRTLQTNVVAVNSLVSRAENGDPNALTGLSRYIRKVEAEAFGSRLFTISSESHIRECYAATSRQDALEKAKRTLQDVINILSSGVARAKTQEPVGDVLWNEWERRNIDLVNLPLLWIYAREDAQPHIDFPVK